MAHSRRPAPPPLEANDRRVTIAGTVAWAVALAVLLELRGGGRHGAVRAVVRAPLQALPRPQGAAPGRGPGRRCNSAGAGLQRLEDRLLHRDAGHVDEVIAELIDDRPDRLAGRRRQRLRVPAAPMIRRDHPAVVG